MAILTRSSRIWRRWHGQEEDHGIWDRVYPQFQPRANPAWALVPDPEQEDVAINIKYRMFYDDPDHGSTTVTSQP